MTSLWTWHRWTISSSEHLSSRLTAIANVLNTVCMSQFQISNFFSKLYKRQICPRKNCPLTVATRVQLIHTSPDWNKDPRACTAVCYTHCCLFWYYDTELINQIFSNPIHSGIKRYIRIDRMTKTAFFYLINTGKVQPFFSHVKVPVVLCATLSQMLHLRFVRCLEQPWNYRIPSQGIRK